MYIKKIKINAVRISSTKDIPPELEDTIHIEGDKIYCLNAESHGKYVSYPLGCVIGYDLIADTPTGKGAWRMDDNSYIEKDNGEIACKYEIRKAERIRAPFSIDTKYGVQTLETPYGYLVTRPDGSQTILSAGTTSESYYMVCTEDGEDICLLTKYNPNEQE